MHTHSITNEISLIRDGSYLCSGFPINPRQV